MPFPSFAASLRDFVACGQPASPDILKVFEECRKTSLNILIAFVALHSISGSTSLAAVTLVLLLYTLTLHLACGVGAIKELDSRILEAMNAVPGFGICAITCIELVYAVESTAVAVCLIALCFVPPTLALCQHTRLCIRKKGREHHLGSPKIADELETGSA
ncbi:hypothetical protein BV22DRAFT_76204 [Leucogyrophana mollusca]|uniref:Uncharacterized protein n=1 Tax=Leucogyrophana mollusca TaxID=85980 RepID=A0ACB8BXD6_9AGAM|nr:hypothetical protein BV22DRAFT_76204 [Leucogyrophana mollusca]